MAIYYSVRLLTNLVCDCSAYKFPHPPSKNLCEIPCPSDADKLEIQLKLSPATKKKIVNVLSLPNTSKK